MEFPPVQKDQLLVNFARSYNILCATIYPARQQPLFVIFTHPNPTTDCKLVWEKWTAHTDES